MGLRCLIGHDYAPPETEREREDRGGEVVVTIREFKECRRCGDRQVISENTEVRANEEVSRDRESPDPDHGIESVQGTDDAGEYEEMSAEDDDGVILPDEEEADPEERQRGEWPDSDDEGDEETGSAEDDRRDWPETEGEDEGYDAVAGDDEPVEDVEFGGGLTPERSGQVEDSDAEASGGSDDSPSAGIRSAAPGPSPVSRQRPDADIDTVLECPECGHATAGDGTSLRPGDICPECRRGYLTERERE